MQKLLNTTKDTTRNGDSNDKSCCSTIPNNLLNHSSKPCLRLTCNYSHTARAVYSSTRKPECLCNKKSQELQCHHWHMLNIKH